MIKIDGIKSLLIKLRVLKGNILKKIKFLKQTATTASPPTKETLRSSATNKAKNT
jgi:hypothetical protein